MSLAITNQKNLNNILIFLISNDNNDTCKTVIREGDFVKIFINDKLVGLNVFNYTKYFNAENGIHSITQNQKNILVTMGIEFNYDSNLVIGEIIKREIHPSSEKLFVLKVLIGDEELQIVTNSINSLVHKKVVVAKIGAILPLGIKIQKTKVLGVESFGMLCGGETLGFQKESGVLLVQGKNGDEFIF